MPKSESQPPPNIGHLMLWTASSAILLATIRLVDEQFKLGAVPLLINGTRCIFGGVVISGFCIFARRKLKGGPPFPAQPAHWFLIIDGAGNLIWLGLINGYMISAHFDKPRAELFTWAVFPAVEAIALGTCLPLTIMAITKIGPFEGRIRWGLYFLFGFVSAVVQIFAQLGIIANYSLGGAELAWCIRVSDYAPVAAAACALFPALLDVALRAKRDWMHWLAVITILGMGTTRAIWISLNG